VSEPATASAWQVTVLTLFPRCSRVHWVNPPPERRWRRHLALEQVDIRDFASDKHRSVDDAPFGGGPGMVLMPDNRRSRDPRRHRGPAPVVYLTPRGRRLDQANGARLCRAILADARFAAVSRAWTSGCWKRMASRRSASAISCLRRRTGGPGADRCHGAASARRDRRGGDAGGGEFRTGIAGISPLHAPAEWQGRQGAGGAGFPRPPRESQGLAVESGRGGD